MLRNINPSQNNMFVLYLTFRKSSDRNMCVKTSKQLTNPTCSGSQFVTTKQGNDFARAPYKSVFQNSDRDIGKFVRNSHEIHTMRRGLKIFHGKVLFLSPNLTYKSLVWLLVLPKTFITLGHQRLSLS